MTDQPRHRDAGIAMAIAGILESGRRSEDVGNVLRFPYGGGMKKAL
jgi:hypothetical protein